MNDDYDTTEKVERTDVGYRVTITSTRGTGTRDQDKVKVESRQEAEPDSEDLDRLSAKVRYLMDKQRSFTPGDDRD